MDQVYGYSQEGKYGLHPSFEEPCYERALFLGGSKHWQEIVVDITKRGIVFSLKEQYDDFIGSNPDKSPNFVLESYYRHWIKWRDGDTVVFYAVFATTSDRSRIESAVRLLVEETKQVWHFGHNRFWLAKSLLDYYHSVFLPNLVRVTIENKMPIKGDRF